jgi:integrase
MPNPLAHAHRLCNRAEEYGHEGSSECDPRVQASAVEQRQADRGKAAATTQTHVWSIRTKLQIEGRIRDLALFNLAIDSKLRGCDVVAIRVEDIAAGGYTADRATVRQKKTGRPVRFELSEQTRQAVDDYLKITCKRPGEFLFTGHCGPDRSLTTRQYARLVSEWIGSVGLDPRLFGTHSLRRTKATLIYRRTGNLRAVQLLLGHTKIESTVRYLGIEVDDALAIAEQVDV